MTAHPGQDDPLIAEEGATSDTAAQREEKYGTDLEARKPMEVQGVV